MKKLIILIDCYCSEFKVKLKRCIISPFRSHQQSIPVFLHQNLITFIALLVIARTHIFKHIHFTFFS